MAASSFFSGMGFRKLIEMLVPLCNNLVTGRVFPTWKNTVPLCSTGTYWYYGSALYQAIQESGTTSANGVHAPNDGLLYWQKVSFTPMGMGDDEVAILTELNNLRQASIGRPQWATSTTPPADHVLVNGDFISFAGRPEFKAKYDAGGFAGLLMAYNADATTQAANKGMFRPDAAIPTGLYLPVDGGAYYQAWTAAANGTAGTHLNAGLPNATGSLPWWGGSVGGTDNLNTIGIAKQATTSSANLFNMGGDPVGGRRVEIDLSRASTVFGGSTTVTPDTIKRPVIMYLGRADKVLSVSAAAKNWMATTTSVGFGRVATGVDLIDSATINNGPAFIAAGVNTAVTPNAGKIPVANQNGSLVAWVPTGRRNRLCNGDFRISQQHGSLEVIPTTVDYIADNARLIIVAASKLKAQRMTTSLSKLMYSEKITTAVATTPGTNDKYHLNMCVEGFDLSDLCWGTPNAKPITVSFTVKVNTAGKYAFSVCLANGTLSYVFTKDLAVGENVCTQTIPGCQTGTWPNDSATALVLRFDLGCGSGYITETPKIWQASNVLTTAECIKLVAVAGATYEIGGVQLEAGTEATEFEFLTFQQALNWCRRYFQKSYDVDTVLGSITNNGALCNRTIGVAEWNGFVNFSVPMRVVPSVTVYSPVTGAAGYFRQYDGNAADKVARADTFMGTTSIRIYGTCDAVSQYGGCHWIADARM
jgi:hypothetical protein